MKKIGLIGGISSTSTKIYYDRIIFEYYQQNKKYPEIIIYSVDLQKYLLLLNSNKHRKLAHEFLTVIDALKKAGADFAVITAVSMHIVIKFLKNKSSLPIIDGIGCLVQEMIHNKRKSVLLLGTDYVMKSKQFKDYFEKENIKVITPSAKQRAEIEFIIKDQLNKGIIKTESKKKIISIIKQCEKKIDCVCLACTALPSIISQSDLPFLKLYDFIDTHIKEIISALE